MQKQYDRCLAERDKSFDDVEDVHDSSSVSDR